LAVAVSEVSGVSTGRGAFGGGVGFVAAAAGD
jgi:hypothetical protein